MRKERVLNSRSLNDRFLAHSMLGWMDEQAKEKEACQNSTMEKVATLVRTSGGRDYVMWKRIMAKGDMAVSQAPMRLRQLTCAEGYCLSTKMALSTILIRAPSKIYGQRLLALRIGFNLGKGPIKNF